MLNYRVLLSILLKLIDHFLKLNKTFSLVQLTLDCKRSTDLKHSLMFIVAGHFLQCGSISVLKHTMAISEPKLEVSEGPESLLPTGCQQSSSQQTVDVALQTCSGSNTSSDVDQLSNEVKKIGSDVQETDELGAAADELGDMSLSSTVSEGRETQPTGTALVADEQASGAGDGRNITTLSAVSDGSRLAVTDAQSEPDRSEAVHHSEDGSSADSRQTEAADHHRDTDSKLSSDSVAAAVHRCDEVIDEDESLHHRSPPSTDDVKTAANVDESEAAVQTPDDNSADVKLPGGNRDEETSSSEFEHITGSPCHSKDEMNTDNKPTDDVYETEAAAQNIDNDVKLPCDTDAAEHVSIRDQALTGTDAVVAESTNAEPCVDFNSIADIPALHVDNKVDELAASVEESTVEVLVSDIPRGLGETVEMYLESRKKGGGTIKSFKYNERSGSALVVFTDNAGDFTHVLL